MLKTIATAIMTVASLMPAPVKKAEKPPLAEIGSLFIKVLPERGQAADGNYVVEGEQSENKQTSAEERYRELKDALDERFAYMFELKASLEQAQSVIGSKWDEYYALHEKYNRELKKIIAAWVTESNYTSNY